MIDEDAAEELQQIETRSFFMLFLGLPERFIQGDELGELEDDKDEDEDVDEDSSGGTGIIANS